MIDRNASEDVMLAYCTTGQNANCFMTSVINSFNYDMKTGYGDPPRRRLADFHYSQTPYIADGRANLAKQFLENPECADLQWLWFCDTDMDFPADTLHKMLRVAEESDKKFLAAAYWNTYPHMETYLSWLVFVEGGVIRPIEGLLHLDAEALDENGLLPVHAVGMGCTLIHRDVLQDVADMHPNDPWDTFGSDVLLTFEDGQTLIGRSAEDFKEAMDGPYKDRPIRQIQRMGEDVTFSIRALRAGYPPHGIPWLVVDHVKTHKMIPGDRVQPSADGVSLSPVTP